MIVPQLKQRSIYCPAYMLYTPWGLFGTLQDAFVLDTRIYAALDLFVDQYALLYLYTYRSATPDKVEGITDEETPNLLVYKNCAAWA